MYLAKVHSKSEMKAFHYCIIETLTRAGAPSTSIAERSI